MNDSIVEGVDDAVLFFFIGVLLFGVFVARHCASNAQAAISRLELDRIVQWRRTHDVPIDHPNRLRSHENDDDDPISLTPIEYGLETSCGHKFSTASFMDYWEHTFRPRPVICPLCRREVNTVYRHFTSAEEEASETAADAARSSLRQYNACYNSPSRGLVEQLRDLPPLIRRFGRDLCTRRGMVMSFFFCRMLLLFLGAVLYLLAPFDIIPESIVGVLGMLDDALVLLGACLILASTYRAQLLNAIQGMGTACGFKLL